MQFNEWSRTFNVNAMNLQKRANAVLDGLGAGEMCVFGWEGFLRYITVLPFSIHRNHLLSFFFLLVVGMK